MALVYIPFFVRVVDSVQSCVQAVHAFLGLAALCMQVAVHRHAGIGVPQAVADGFDVHVLIEKHITMRVPEIVQANGGESNLLQNLRQMFARAG